MKTNTIFTFLGLLLANVLIAQPTIDQTVLLQVGDIANVQPFPQAIAAFDPGPAGADVSWDFSSVQAQGAAYSWKAVEPSTSPYADSFPSATLAYEVLEDTSSWVYYYTHTSAALNLLGGIGAIGANDTFVYNFSQNTQMEMRMSLSYGDQHLDTARGYARVSVMGNLFIVDRTIYRSLRADGYGSLQTPAGSYQNVLRVRIEEEVVDRLFNQVVARQANHRYFWLSPDHKYELMHMDSLVTLGPTGTVSSSSTYNYYQTNPISTSIEVAREADAFSIYPNPAKKYITLRPAGTRLEALGYRLCDAFGKLQLTGKIPPNKEEITLDIAGLRPGYYFLSLQGKTYSATRKLIIQ